MKDFDDVLISLQVIMEDVRYKAELKRQKELEAERLNQDIEILKGKAIKLLQENVELKAQHGVSNQ